MRDCLSDKIYFNNSVLELEKIDFEIFNLQKTLYEVVRVIDGFCLFYEDHFFRFLESTQKKAFVHSISLDDFKEILFNTIEINRMKNGNIKLMFSFRKNVLTEIVAYSCEAKYPTSLDYKDGVNLKLLKAERNYPNIKTLNPILRNKADEMIEKNRIFETLLVNTNNEITEGSRSNVFFIVSGKVHTPPGSEALKGITRNKIIFILQKNNIMYAERKISVNELEDFDAVFISGTSPKVLPVNAIEAYKYDINNSVLIQILNCYNSLILEYIKRQ